MSAEIISFEAARRLRNQLREAAKTPPPGPAELPELCGFSLREYDALNHVYRQGVDAGLFTHRRIFIRNGLPCFDMCHDSHVNWPLFRIIRAARAGGVVYACLASHGFEMNELFEGTNLEIFAGLLARQVAEKIGSPALSPPKP